MRTGRLRLSAVSLLCLTALAPQPALSAPKEKTAKPVEAESLEKPPEALEAGADIVMPDELSLDDMREAARLTAGRAKLEASGGINDSTLRVIAETGVDYISLGTLTKDVKAVDLSMRLAL